MNQQKPYQIVRRPEGRAQQELLQIQNYTIIYMEGRITITAKTTLKKKNKVGGLKILDFKTQPRGTVVKTI